MSKTFAIGIPTINRIDLLDQALSQYKTSLPNTNIFIVDNGGQGIEVGKYSPLNIEIYVPGFNIGVAGSWNYLCRVIFYSRGYDYAMILNDDIIIDHTEEEYEKAINFINSVNKFGIKFLYLSEKDWCFFLLSREVYEKVGDFDEAFYPAYFEDNDYAYRMKLEKVGVIKNRGFNPKVYNNSMTSRKDPNINNGFMQNREYYIKKWGGLPGQETFTTPFGNNK